MQIIIPTLARCDTQITLANLPEHWQKHTTLVVQEHEYAYMKNKYSAFCSVWCLPPNTKGIAWTRKHIAKQWHGERIFVMDDDLKFVQLKQNSDGKYVGQCPTRQEFDEAFAAVEKHMDAGIVHGGFAVNNTPPADEPFNYSSRVYTNAFFSEKFPGDEISFGEEYELMPEDFFVTLQLLTRGFQNVCFNHFRVNPSATNSKGGCAEYRNIDNHNRGQEILAEKFPDFVTVTSKVQKSGPWAGKEKKALSIQWKKAYESSKQTSSLEDFF
jgi:hypothetical protein